MAISVDPAAVNHAFAEREGIKYPVLSDPEGEVTHRFGVVRADVARRVTFILDEDGRIRHIDRNVRVTKHGPDLLKRMAALQAERAAAQDEPGG